MKTRSTTRRLVAGLAAVLFAAHLSFAQQKDEPKVEMQNYFLFLLNRAPGATKPTGPSHDELIGGHLAHLR